MKKTAAKIASVVLAAAVSGCALAGCGNINKTNAKTDGKSDSGKVYVYNWGEYIDPETITMFESETGIKVVYDEFETNEAMYPKIAAGAAQYDVVCPSDYMVNKMMDKGLLQELDYSKLPNVKKNIGTEYFKMADEFDPGNKYCVPYCWGTVGILYNKKMVDEPITSWAQLWDEKYKDNILMQDSVRDAFMVAEKKNGYSMNTTDKTELEKCKDDLITQKPLVQAYVIDEVRDKMIGGEAAIGVIYSGEAIYTQRENPDLVYVIPSEGTNLWIDGWVVPKDAPDYDNAMKFIDFMARGDVAEKNFDYITYSTPNTAAKDLIQDTTIKNSETAFPDLSKYKGLETYTYLGEDADKLYNSLWEEVKAN